MKRKLVLSGLFLILGSAAGWLLFLKILTLLGKNVFYIAIVATEEEKDDVLQGVRLCLQHAQKSGKLYSGDYDHRNFRVDYAGK